MARTAILLATLVAATFAASDAALLPKEHLRSRFHARQVATPPPCYNLQAVPGYSSSANQFATGTYSISAAECNARCADYPASKAVQYSAIMDFGGYVQCMCFAGIATPLSAIPATGYCTPCSDPRGPGSNETCGNENAMNGAVSGAPLLSVAAPPPATTTSAPAPRPTNPHPLGTNNPNACSASHSVMFLDGQPWHTSPEAPVRGGSHLPVIGPLKPGNYSGEMVLNAEAYASGVQQTVTGYVKLELDADKAVLLYQAVPPQVWTQSYIVDNLGLAISCAPMRHVDLTYDEELSRCAAPSPVYRLDTTRGSSQPFPQCGDAGYYITVFAHQWLSQPSQITPGANCAIPGCPV